MHQAGGVNGGSCTAWAGGWRGGGGGRRLTFAALLGAMVGIGGMQGGCFVHLPADSDRSKTMPTVLPADAWPKWDNDALGRVRLTIEDSLYDRDYDMAAINWNAPVIRYTDVFRARLFVYPDAIVRVWLDKDGRPAPRQGMFGGMLNGFNENTEILTAARFGGDREKLLMARTEAGVGDAVSPGLPIFCGLDPVDTERRRFAAGIDARIPAEKPDRPRGVLIHHPSLFGNEYETAVVNELRSRGWIILSVSTRKSIARPYNDELIAKAIELDRQILAIRRANPKMIIAPAGSELNKLERERMELDYGKWTVTNPSEAEDTGREIASCIDRGLAEGAVATRSALDALLALRPELKGLPISMIGFSAGSLAATTIASSMRDRVSCLALVGPACNLAAAGIQSSYYDGGIKLIDKEGKKLVDTNSSLSNVVAESYLKHSRLDPYYTAPTLTKVPVLVVRGWFDGWVPANLCDTLIDRLGTPDRLAIPGGHQVLFFLLPSQKSWIADWLDEHTPASPGYAPAQNPRDLAERTPR